DVSTDGGKQWEPAELQQPVLPKCHTRFRYLWKWDGRETTLRSRAVDETGYVQPTLEQLRNARGLGTAYHFNHIRAWRVQGDGTVVFGLGGCTVRGTVASPGRAFRSAATRDWCGRSATIGLTRRRCTTMSIARCRSTRPAR